MKNIKYGKRQTKKIGIILFSVLIVVVVLNIIITKFIGAKQSITTLGTDGVTNAATTVVTTSEEPTIESVKNFYYNQLTSEIAQCTYKTLLADTDATGSVCVNFEDVKASQYSADKIKSYVMDGLVAFFDDHPEYYWWYYYDVSYGYLYYIETPEKMYTKIDLKSGITEKKYNAAFQAKLEEVANSITGNSVYDIAKSCHDYVCKNVKYASKSSSDIDQTAYDALMNGSAICEGQAGLFKALCDKNGIMCITVGGRTSGGVAHAWNYVYHPEEKEWYAVDITYDTRTPVRYTYFLIGSDNYGNVVGFKNSGQTYTPKTPTLAKTWYKIFNPTVSYSSTQKTDNDVTVTITSALKYDKTDNPNKKRKLTAMEGWTLSDDGLSLTKVYSNNKVENITVVNERGESCDLEINVSNIEKPILTAEYTKDTTNGNVTVTITSDRQVNEVSGWTLSSDKLKLTKTYSENKEETITVYDLNGYKANITIKVNDIGNTAPEVTFNPKGNSTKAKSQSTNVTVSDSGSGIDTLKYQWTKSKISPTEDSFETSFTSGECITKDKIDGTWYLWILAKDKLGNTTIERSNAFVFDNTKPSAEVTYNIKEETNQNVVVTITANEEIQAVEGWTLSINKQSLSKEYSENTSETVTIKDIAGNTEDVSITINNIGQTR